MMDYTYIKHNDEDFGLKDDLFGSHANSLKCGGALEVMDENWATTPDLDSIFPMDFLNNLNYQQGSFGTLDDLTEHIKMEAEDYEISVPSVPEPLFSSPESNNISSNSSDSGLSSDNLEVEMSPQYEPLSPCSPHLSRSEQIGNKSPAEIKCVDPIQPATKRVCNNEQKPKVIVQKLPQVMTLTNTVQTNLTTIKQEKQQYPEQQHHRQSAHQTKLLNGVRGNEIKIVKLSPQMFTTSNNKAVTIQVKNSNSGAKIQAKPGTLFLNKTKLTEMKKIVRVQNSNPRSVLIPVSLQDVKELKTFKIVNTTAVRSSSVKKNESTDSNSRNFQLKRIGSPKIFQAMDIKAEAKDDDFIEHSSDSESIIIEDGYDNDDDYVHDPEAPYPKLMLTSEEKRLLSKEGINLPTHYPLTKHEERELKRIRRKIRNKISAQDSRKRKKEYVDGLEERVKQCTEENQTLMKRIKQLQNQNQNLMSQMKKLQNLLTKGTNKTTQPTTCLMVLLLSLALVAAPNLKLGQNPKEGDLEEAVQETILQNRRNLLFNNKDHNTDIFDEDVNMSDILSAVDLNNECESNAVCKTNSNTYTTTSSLGEPKCKKVKLTHTEFIDDIDEENWYLSKSNHVKFNTANALEFQEDNREHLQTSGFNIEKQTKSATMDSSGINNWLDKDILEMVSPTLNGLYELNMDKITAAGTYASPPAASVIDVPAKQMYTNQINVKQNSSEMRQINKY